ncbi:lysophospholipid acyltransferase family protein [Aliiglaciecola sp. LCG003]|uniref:lysophospholipid acyltransferase family protein n=1 Tax=Aliiglaciecola sp. LCG003 TaxID=3053655 RepID=UPI0025747EFB|nr:lysophospholipid acyltransferase family protein [Aliiglaciecola sp. LCG003]WJG07778.1 lysophospholipid acyltransferase family protein [Aliiglaciecola sp. LCG003]
MSYTFNCPKVSQNIPRLGNRFSRWLGKTVLKSKGWRFEGEFPDNPKLVVCVAPHTSNWDFVIGLAVAFCLKLKISFFGKHSIFIPPFSWLLKRWGGIPIERSKSHGVVTQMIETVKSTDKILLCLAPEGTRSQVYPWKSGFLHIAHHANVPVLLIGLDYQRKTIVLGPVFVPTEDTAAEMQKVYDFYAKVHPKYPSKVAFLAENSFEN